MLRQLKQNLAPILSRASGAVGVSWPWLIDKFGRDALIEQMKVLFKQPFGSTGKAEKPLDFLFMPYIGCFQGNNMIQVTLGKVLQERGHRVRFLVCDIPLPICETTDISTHPRREEICNANDVHLRKFVAATGMEVVLVSDLLSPEELEFNDLSDANRWHTFAESMLLRYFKVGELDRDDPQFDELSAKAKQATLISQKVGEAIVRLNPDQVIMAHGTYTTRGPAREVIIEAGIPLLTISRSKLSQAQKFNWNTPGDWWSVDGTWENEKSHALNDEQGRLIDDYLQSRRTHSKDVMVYNFSDEESREKTLTKLGVDPSHKIYTLFTNVLWDAASAQREIVFDGSVDWVVKTIEAFRDLPDRTLIVRTHPAEAVIGTKQPMRVIIEESIPDLPANVILLAPDAPFNSWSLLKVTDVGLVHTSTVGLELALEGIPCVCVSKTHYRGKGFTVDPESKKEYLSIIRDGVDDFDPEAVKELAKRYAYILFLRYQIPLPFYEPESHIAIRAFKRTDWKEIEASKQIKLVVDCIENQTPEFMMPHEMAAEIHGGSD